jgi:hypothetical protein
MALRACIGFSLKRSVMASFARGVETSTGGWARCRAALTGKLVSLESQLIGQTKLGLVLVLVEATFLLLFDRVLYVEGLLGELFGVLWRVTDVDVVDWRRWVGSSIYVS